MSKRAWLIQSEHIYRSPSGKKAMARVYVPGMGKRDISLGDIASFTSDVSLVRAKNKRVAALIKAGKKKPGSLIRFDELADDLLKQKKLKASKTFISAVTHLKLHLLPWLSRNCPYAINFDESTWDQYIVDQAAINPRRKLFNDRKHMHQLLDLAGKKGALSRIMKLKNPDPKRKKGKRFTDEEIKRLIKAASPVLRLQIMMAFLMGMRRKEILSLAWADIDESRQVLTLRQENVKTRNERSCVINPQVWTELMKVRRTGPYVFASRKTPRVPMKDNKTAWQACKRRAGVTGRFHDLRHTFLSNAFHRYKLPPMDVCAYAGLSIEMAQRVYLHPDEEDTRHISNAIQFMALVG